RLPADRLRLLEVGELQVVPLATLQPGGARGDLRVDVLRAVRRGRRGLESAEHQLRLAGAHEGADDLRLRAHRELAADRADEVPVDGDRDRRPAVAEDVVRLRD